MEERTAATSTLSEERETIMGKPLANLDVPNVAAPKGTRKAREFDVIRSIDYREFRRVRLNGNAGTLFTLSSGRGVESLRDAYSNVVILAGRSQYAPELVARYMFVSDKRYIGYVATDEVVNGARA